jgi:hypothetical protein
MEIVSPDSYYAYMEFVGLIRGRIYMRLDLHAIDITRDWIYTRYLGMDAWRGLVMDTESWLG